MINPQSTTLVMAYEPYLSMERAIYIMPSVQGYLLKQEPDLSVGQWLELFKFDHEHIEIGVACCGFYSMDQARSCLEFVLWNSKKTLRVSTITDMISDRQYNILVGRVRVTETRYPQSLPD